MLKTRQVRSDCRRLSKCGMRSVHWCRTFRSTCEECQDCTLVRTVSRNNVKVVDGVTLRRCCRCGEFLPMTRYSKRRLVRNGKVYEGHRSVCNFCLSKEYYAKKAARAAEEGKE